MKTPGPAAVAAKLTSNPNASAAAGIGPNHEGIWLFWQTTVDVSQILICTACDSGRRRQIRAPAAVLVCESRPGGTRP